MDTAVADTIERQIHIAARPEIVFSYFTDPAKLIHWKGVKAILDPRPGGIYRVEINERNVVRGEYVEVVPYTRIVFTWGWEGENSPLPPGTTTVEIQLTPDDTGTIVQLRHLGLPADQRGSHIEGWDHFLPRLIVAVEKGDAGPDPWSM